MAVSPFPYSPDTTAKAQLSGPRSAIGRHFGFVASLLAALVLAGTAFASPPVESDAASAPVALTLNVVHATAEKGGVAPDLERISKWLLRSFPNYTSFKRLSGREDVVKVGGAVTETLPNGTVLTYRHLGWKEDFATISLSVGGLETTVNVKDGKGFLQAGRSFKDGMIVLAFRVEKGR